MCGRAWPAEDYACCCLRFLMRVTTQRLPVSSQAEAQAAMEAQQVQNEAQPNGQLLPTVLPGAAKPSAVANGTAGAAVLPVAA